MQEHVEILKAAAMASGVFQLVTDDPPNEVGPNKFPAFVQYGRRRRPQVHSTRVYSGFADYTCLILADAKKDGWDALDGYTDAFLKALFARSEAAAIGYEHVEPDRTFEVQEGSIRALVQLLTIRAQWGKEYA